MERTSPIATPQEVAEYRRTTVGALAQERYLGRGPAYIKDGKHVRYRWSDVDAYIDAQVVKVGA